MSSEEESKDKEVLGEIEPLESHFDDLENDVEEVFFEDEEIMKMRKERLLEMYKEGLENRERLLFENTKQQRKLAKILKRSIFDKTQDKQVTDNEERYAKYLSEHRNLRKELEELRRNNTVSLEEMEMRRAERNIHAESKQKQFRQLKYQYAYSAENGSTGRVIPRDVLQDYEMKEIRKDEEVRNIRTRYLFLKNLKDALDMSIKDKEDSKGLHLIDFEQYNMENATLNEKIEEKNENLQKSRLKATTTVHILTHVKEKLQFVQSEDVEMQRKLGELESKLAKHKDILNQLKRERDTIKNENMYIKDSTPLVGSDSLLVDYENRKRELVMHKRRLTELRELTTKLEQFREHLTKTSHKIEQEQLQLQ